MVCLSQKEAYISVALLKKATFFSTRQRAERNHFLSPVIKYTRPLKYFQGEDEFYTTLIRLGKKC